MKVSCQLLKFHFRPLVAFTKPTATPNKGRLSNPQSAISAPDTSTPKYGPLPARKLVGNSPANFQEALEVISALLPMKPSTVLLLKTKFKILLHKFFFLVNPNLL
jgi:hypothetical protein